MADDASLTLILPAYNSAGFLAASLTQAWRWLESLSRPTELLVVDDGSTDGTPLVLTEFAGRVASAPGPWVAGSPQLRLLRNPHNRGKGFSLRRAFLHAQGELIAFTDADLTYPIENVAPIVAALENGADLALGSRMHADSRYVVAPTFFGKLLTRHCMGRIFNLLVRAAAVPGVRDTQAGLKGFRRAAARVLATRVHMDRFSFDVELLFVARALGLRIVETPVTFLYRKEPSTVRFVRDSCAMLRDLARIRWRALRGVYAVDMPAARLAELLDGGSMPGAPLPLRAAEATREPQRNLHVG